MKKLQCIIAIILMVCLMVFMNIGISQGEEKMTLQISSAGFDHKGKIPSVYTCEGKDTSPPLAWQGVPAGTRSLVLIVDDPDAPDPKAPRMTWVHWVLFNIPPDAEGLPEGATEKDLPPGTRQGMNDWKRTGYGGPCPPIGRHRYFHKLYALDVELELNKPTKEEVIKAMEGHILSHAELVGTYKKGR